MLPPPGFNAATDQVCKLEKSLYGLKWASRQWNFKLTEALKGKGFVQAHADSSLFIKHSGSTFIALVIYVDDVIVASYCLFQVQDIKTFLHKTFGIKELGELKFFLGFKVARSDKGINICQRKYMLDLLSEIGFLGSKPAATPLVSSVKLSKSDGSPAVDNTTYRQLLVKLLYLTHTRLDITFAVQQLLQFLEALTGCHMQAAHRVLQYLKNAPGQGLFYPGQNSLQLKGFSDSYWGTCADSRKSITGYCVFLGQSL